MRLKASPIWTGLCEATLHADGTATIGYFVFTPFAGARFGQEQVRLMLGHLAASGVGEIRAQVDTRNVASFTLLERLGFVRAATVVAADHFKGAASDEHHFLLRLP